MEPQNLIHSRGGGSAAARDYSSLNTRLAGQSHGFLTFVVIDFSNSIYRS